MKLDDVKLTYEQKLEVAMWIIDNNSRMLLTGSIMLKERGIDLGREPNDEMYRNRLIRLEKDVTESIVKKGVTANFFQTGKIPGRFCLTNENKSPTVEEVFNYITRNDNVNSLFDFDDESLSCMSVYHGLCE